jgi:hypothetical protein
VRQGDPLGPLLFALTSQEPLEQVAAMDLARPLEYADDSFLQGAPKSTVQAFHALLTLAGPFGLHPQLDKFAVYSADAGAATSVVGKLGAQHAPMAFLPREPRPAPQGSRQHMQTADPHMPAT